MAYFIMMNTIWVLNKLEKHVIYTINSYEIIRLILKEKFENDLVSFYS